VSGGGDAEIALLIDLHLGLDRLGPGTDALTRAALARCAGLPPRPQIADLGCGAGASALVLAEATGGELLAIDRVPAFVDHLRRRACARGLEGRVRAEVADMAAPPIAPGSLDLIWSEGAAYFLGVEGALRAWGPLLRPGGWLSFTELCWTLPDGEAPPAACAAFWAEGYPAMGTPAQHLATAADLGWAALDPEVLPPAAWAAYHGPLEARLGPWAAARAGDPVAQQIAGATRAEIALVRAHPGAFSYVRFTLQRGG
jgi:SAM-dependent methyltransferase